jgi:adenylate cyclase
MKKKLWLLCMTLACIYPHAKAQVKNVNLTDTVKVNALLQQFKETVGESQDKSFGYAREAKEISEKLNYKKGLAAALKSMGIARYYAGKNLQAVDYWQQSIKVFESINDNTGVANILSNIGAIYFDQGEDDKALDYYLRSLKIAEQLDDKLRIATALNNVGGVYANKKATYNKALPYFLNALSLAEESGDKEAIRTTTSNLGEVYALLGKDTLALKYYNKSLKIGGDSESSPYTYNLVGKFYAKRGDYEKALYYHNRAYNLAKKFDGQLDLVQSLEGEGSSYQQMHNYPSAITSYAEAETIANQINANKELEPIYNGMAASYAAINDYSNAYLYKTKHAVIKDKLYDEERDKTIAFMQYDFDLQKKESRINLLTKENSLRALQLNRQRILRSALIIVLILILIIAYIMFRDYRVKARVNKLLDQQKNEIEHLLLNILPAPVAKELQEKGEATPRYYESVSVMFTDFKGFTTIADTLSPEQVIDELSTCFMAFDNIIEKYNLEKIKTIGDSYMCAGGVPVLDENHVYKMIKASLEIQNYMIIYNMHREQKGLSVWDLRIGVHVGPVVAGVVGKKKYAYDIWGSTVNIASRMESNGSPGRVNISYHTYELIKDRFVCSPRGKIYAKNVGEIDMFFVDHEINPFAELKTSIPHSEIPAEVKERETETQPVSHSR